MSEIMQAVLRMSPELFWSEARSVAHSMTRYDLRLLTTFLLSGWRGALALFGEIDL